MGLGLEAPAAISVEVRAPDERVFRLSQGVSDEAIRLARAAPFEIGREVEIRFLLPDALGPLSLHARVTATGDAAEEQGERGGCKLTFIKPSEVARDAVNTYVLERLGLPPLKGPHGNDRTT